MVAISYFLPIRQFLSPLVVFLKRHAYSPASSNAGHTADFSGAKIEELFYRTELAIGHQPIDIGAGLVLETYALLIRKAILKLYR